MRHPHTNAWTWLNWLETVAALSPMLEGQTGPTTVNIDEETHGIKVYIDGVRVTMYGLNILEANQLASGKANKTFSPEMISLLQKSVNTPELHALLTDHPQELVLSHLDEVEMWQHLETKEDTSPAITLTPQALRSLHAIHRAAVSQIVRGNEHILRADRALPSAIGLTVALFAMSFFIPTQLLQVLLYLLTALSAYRTAGIYNRKLGGIHEIRKSERNLQIGLEKQGFPV